MDDLDLGFVTILLKRICSQRCIRLLASISHLEASTDEWKQFTQWFRDFYRYVDSTNQRFCVIFTFQTGIENATRINDLILELQQERAITRRLSVTTCVVAPPMLAFVAQMAMNAYCTQGHVHFLDTLDDAKKLCRKETFHAYEQGGVSG